jgi:2-dehydropantoate 2-reductase
MRYTFIGAGAVGGFYGALLARQGHDVSFVARGAHRDAIAKDGLRVTGPIGDFTVKVRAESDPAKLGPTDVVVLAVKTYDNDSAIPMITPLLGPDTVVLPLQNGVDSSEAIAAVIGREGDARRLDVYRHRDRGARPHQADGRSPAHRVGSISARGIACRTASARSSRR